jgi:WD40 repeat protein
LTHENSVESVDLASSGSILSGDWDGRICVWQSNSDEVSESETAVKKRKVGGASAASLRELVPVAAFKAHAQCVSGVAWMPNTDDVGGSGGICASAVTCSWDHSVKSWDVERSDCVSTINGAKVSVSLSDLRRASHIQFCFDGR